MNSKIQFFARLFAVVLIAAATLFSPGASTTEVFAAPESKMEEGVGRGTELLQFTSASHVLGFSPDKVYLAGGDHALAVTFVDAQEVMPQASSFHGGAQAQAAPLEQVRYTGLWQGIDVVYFASQGSIAKSAYYLSPGADVRDIRLAYNAPMQLNTDGSLRFVFESGVLTESAPVAWQDIDGARVDVSVRFVQRGEREVGFELGNHSAAHALVIDPAFTWYSVFGGAGLDEGRGVTVDGNGNIIVVGESIAPWNGPGGIAPLHAFGDTNDSDDIFVVKMDSGGNYLWHTFYGANSGRDDNAGGVKVDASGNIFVVGDSVSWNGPTGQSPKHAYSGGGDLFVLRLARTGGYVWHTFYGTSNSDDYSMSVAIGTDSSVYAVGRSSGSWQGDSNANPLNAFSGSQSGFVLKLTLNAVYVWHTFYGTTGAFEDVAIDGNNNLYLTGNSLAWNGPGNIPPINPHYEHSDIFVLKLNSAGAYLWHTFHGGSSGFDEGTDIAVAPSGNIYVTGPNQGWNGPGNIPPLHSGGGAFLLKLNNSGQYQWHTGYGPLSLDSTGIAVGSNETIFTSNFSFGVWDGPNGEAPIDPGDILYTTDWNPSIVRFDSAGNFRWHAFYGVTTAEIVSDANGYLFLGGWGDGTYNGVETQGTDLAVLKLNPEDTFTDVAYNHWASYYIETLYRNSITSGCATSPLQYCPNKNVTRAELAVFLLRGMHGSSYTPPAVGTSTGFSDVPTSHWAAVWIKQLAVEGVTGGCGGGKFCPNNYVTRAEMAVFLLRGAHGSSYAPPAVGSSTGFSDVPTTHWAAAWIKQLAAEGVTSGCGGGKYCPNSLVTRAEMAVFIVKVFNLK